MCSGRLLAHLLSIGTKFEAEFGGYHHLTAERSNRFAHKLFVCERAVCFSRVEECHAAFDAFTYESDHLLLVGSRTVAIAHSHAAQSESRNLGAASSQFALPHCVHLHCHSGWLTQEYKRFFGEPPMPDVERRRAAVANRLV